MILNRNNYIQIFTWVISACVFYLAAIGSWSGGIWLYPAVMFIVFLTLPIKYSVPLLLGFLPFTFPALRPYSDTLQLWRLLAAAVALGLLVKNWKELVKINYLKLSPKWLRVFAAIFLVVLVGIPFATSKTASISKLIFVVNAAIVGFCVYFVISKWGNVKQVMVGLLTASSSILLIGFFQYIYASTRLTFDFWQYWAEVVSRNIYGNEIANVLWYSNSWFTVTKEGLVLRMFSIMPDSHSFALMCMFGIGCLIYFFVSKYINKTLFITGVILFGLAIVFSGTRGVWVGMLLPLFVFSFLYFWKPTWKKILLPGIAAVMLVVLSFGLSPVVRKGLALAIGAGSVNDFARARSIYDTDESSNAGRIAIWSESLLLAMDNPLGVGFGNFLNARVGGTTDEEHINPGYNLPEKYITAHSLYLQTLVELGVVGVIVFLWFLFEIFKAIYKLIGLAQSKGDTENLAVLITVAFCGLWLVGFSVFDVTIFNDKILFVVFSGLGLLLATEMKLKQQNVQS